MQWIAVWTVNNFLNPFYNIIFRSDPIVYLVRNIMFKTVRKIDFHLGKGGFRYKNNTEWYQMCVALSWLVYFHMFFPFIQKCLEHFSSGRSFWMLLQMHPGLFYNFLISAASRGHLHANHANGLCHCPWSRHSRCINEFQIVQYLYDQIFTLRKRSRLVHLTMNRTMIMSKIQ